MVERTREDEIMSKFIGKYRQIGPAENYEEYLKALGQGYLARKAALMLTWENEISSLGDGWWLLKASSLVMTILSKFKLNVPFDVDTPQFKSHSVMSLDGEDGLVQRQTMLDNNSVISSVRRFHGDSLTLTSTTNGVSCIFHFTKHQS